jgi:hypothetical protein
VAGGALEQLRSLPYAVVTAGLQSSDLSGDPYVVPASGGGYRLSVPASALGTSTAIDEPLVVAGSSPPAPLYPHVSTPAAASYPAAFRTSPSLSVYVTKNSTDAGAFTLTAMVRWTPPGGVAKLVVERTLLFSPPGSGGA